MQADHSPASTRASDVGAMTTPRLELKGVAAGYGRSQVLTNIDLRVEAGKGMAILGPNGAGKTTIARTIIGLLRCTSGTILLDGEDITGSRTYARARSGIAYVPEGRMVFPGLTVEENLIVAHRSSRQSAHSKLLEVFDLLPKLGERKRQLGFSLSGGEQQMVALGRAFMNSPKVLILDEPSLGLSPIAVRNFYSVLRRAVDETNLTVVLIEQYVHLALTLCDDFSGIRSGRVARAGRSSDVGDGEDLAEMYLGSEE
jgi:branched-chain amino acid transport system ATP-binding protein